MNKETVLYTAISSRYDTLRPPPSRWREHAAFIAYTEDVHNHIGWDHRAVCREFADPRRNAKVHKVIPTDIWDDYGFSIWVDGAIIIKSADLLPELIENWLSSHDIAVFKHRTRDCIYQEAIACENGRRDSALVIREQIARYRSLGYPENNGLHECTVIVRRHTPAVRAMCLNWWEEIKCGSVRDQLSFDYVLWKHGLTVADLPGTNMNNDHFLWVHHDPNGSPPLPIT